MGPRSNRFSLPFLLCISLLFFGFLSAQIRFEGTVTDASTKKPLPFATVLVKESGKGVTTDIDGRFQIQVPRVPATLEISYLGYYSHVWDISELSTSPLRISLTPTPVQLATIEFSPGLSPAERWIRRIWAKKDTLDPNQRESYTYDAYQRMVFTAAMDSIVATTSTDITGKVDSSMIKTKAFLERQYLFLNESVIRKKYKKPRSYEEVIASKTSGTTNPIFSALTTQLQSLSFFEDQFNILGIKYVNPLSPGGWKKYFYAIEDTVLVGTDSILVISFRPYQGEEKEALKGQFRVNITDIALETALARPVDEKENRLSILQQYAAVDSLYWFPTQWHVDLVFSQANVNGIPMKLEARTYIRDVVIHPPLRNREFGALAVEVAPDAVKKAEERLETYRQNPMEKKDSTTYQFMDSVGKSMNIDRRLKGLDALLTGKFRIGIIDIDINRLMAANQYEGFRLGFGAETNENLIRWFKFGGYFAYGFKDAAFKYGGFGEFLIQKKYDLRLRGFYRRDVFESGSTEIDMDVPFSMDAAYRNLAVARFDSTEQAGFRMTVRPVANLNLWLTGSHVVLNPTFPYAFSDTNFNQTFRWAELEASARWGIGEKYIAFGFTRMRLPSQKPVFFLSVQQAFPMFNGTQQFTRVLGRVEESYRWKKMGKTNLTVLGGLVFGDAPFARLFNGRGSYTDVSVVSGNAFETARANEFMQDRFISIFARHQFPAFFTFRKLMKPSLSVHYNAGWGGITDPGRHAGQPIQAMEKGLFEAGLSLNNVIVLNGSGFGVGVFHRHGAYATGQFTDDIFFKMALTFNGFGN